MDTLYGFGKPYLVAEWALEAEDDPAWAQRMFDWVAAHPRTVGLVYFNRGWSGGSGVYELRSKPRSLDVYKKAIRHTRFLDALRRRGELGKPPSFPMPFTLVRFTDRRLAPPALESTT